jgi:protein-tyrosine phosphatase
MDSQNYRDTKALARKHGFDACDIRMLRRFDPIAKEPELDVPDPWYGGEEGFEEVFQIISRSCASLLDALESNHPNMP